MNVFTVFLLNVYISYCLGANILAVFNHPGASHTTLGMVLLKNLAQRGHQVVMVSSFPTTEVIPNYRDIFLSDHLEDLKRRNKIYFSDNNRGAGLQELRNMTLQHTEDTFTNKEVKELLKSNETFDVIIVDWFFNEATLIFGHIYKAPVIYLSSFGNMALLNDFTGNVLPFSYVPGAALLTSDDMSFKHRLIMTLFNIANSLFIYRRHTAHYEILKRHFEDPPTIEQLQKNIALVLSNSHFSFETPRPYTPNIIPVGGLHIGNLKGLPEDLKYFLDSASEGVIFLSLGSQIKSSNLGTNVLDSMMRTFRKVPQKVLWKFESDEIPGLPVNVKLVKWAPQQEILAHPNVKLFVTHGGMLSFIEAVYYHVPMVCLPFNGDQLTNAAFIASRNMGLYVLFENLDETILSKAIEEVINNPKYQQEMAYRSSLMREQIVSPLETATFWVEHVIKHGHGEHLKTFAIQLPWYKYYLLDVISVMLGGIYVFIKILTFCIRKIMVLFHRSLSRKPKFE